MTTLYVIFYSVFIGTNKNLKEEDLYTNKFKSQIICLTKSIETFQISCLKNVEAALMNF